MMVIFIILMVATNANINVLKIAKFVKKGNALNVIRIILWMNINYARQNMSNLNLVNKRIAHRHQVINAYLVYMVFLNLSLVFV